MSQIEYVWFRSKVDWWLALILVAVPAVELLALISALRAAASDAVVASATGCVLAAAIYGLLLFPVRYGVDTEHLVIRFGVVRRRIPLQSIREVYPTHNPMAAPALSLDRLAIRTEGGGLALASPAEREDFLSLLALRAELTRRGDRLARVVA